MTVPAKLVVDGGRIKATCERRRVESGSPVIIDWCRFTLRRAQVDLWPRRPVVSDSIWDAGWRMNEFRSQLAQMSADDSARESALALEQAEYVAVQVCQLMGPEFKIGPVGKGHDFYRYRLPLMVGDEEVGAVHCWSSSESSRHQGQRETINVNLHGHACMYASNGWEKRLQDFGTATQSVLTAVHLALDFFEGIPGGLDEEWEQYRAGGWDYLGKRPKIGDVNWLQGHSRSLYLGSKKAGKQTNIYEKGHQLYGYEEATRLGIKWERVELRLGNKLRVLDWDILTSPAEYMAGASPRHAHFVELAGSHVEPERIYCNRPDAVMAVEGEVVRAVKWLRDSAAPILALAFKWMPESHFVDVVEAASKPIRLRKFSDSQLAAAFTNLAHPFKQGQTGHMGNMAFAH